MQDVQAVAEREQVTQGEAQNEQPDPLSQLPGTHEMQVVAEVEQFWQGEVHGAQLEPFQ